MLESASSAGTPNQPHVEQTLGLMEINQRATDVILAIDKVAPAQIAHFADTLPSDYRAAFDGFDHDQQRGLTYLFSLDRQQFDELVSFCANPMHRKVALIHDVNNLLTAYKLLTDKE